MIGWGYLVKQGYKILEKNYRTKIGEIDVVAQKGRKISFIEIKTRASSRFGRPEESVHSMKQKKIMRVAEWYLKEKRIQGASVSFDVLAITWKDGGEPEMRLIENALVQDGEIR
jgi:putative endonuclease